MSKHCLFIGEDGALYTWGICEAIGDPNITSDVWSPIKMNLPPNPKKGNLGIHMVATGAQHSVLLTTDNQILVWGSNDFGQLGINNLSEEILREPTFLVLPTDKKISRVCCGTHFSVVLLEDGSLFLWGSNNHGQIGIRDSVHPQKTPLHLTLPEPVVQVACGWEHIFVLTEKGNTFAWGRNDDAKLGLGDRDDRYSPTRVPLPFPDITKVFCGGHYSMVLTKEKKLYGWGWNYQQILGSESMGEEISDPFLMASGVEDVACAWGHRLAFLEGGEVVVWGWNAHGQLGQGHERSEVKPVRLRLQGEWPNVEIVGLVGNCYQSYILTRDGHLWVMGYYQNGVLGLGDQNGVLGLGDKIQWNILEPTKIEGIKFRLPQNSREKWRLIFQWLFLGWKDSQCEFHVLPVEVIYFFVSMFF